MPNNFPGNPPFCSSASVLIVSLTTVNNKPDFSRDLISFISSFEITNVVVPDLNIHLSVADAAVVNSNGIKTFLANDLITFPLKVNPVLSNDPKILPKNILIVVFYVTEFLIIFLVADEPFTKTLRSFELMY